MNEQALRRELVKRLSLTGQHLIGCRRRGAWTNREQPWSFLSGNAVLRTIGQSRVTHTPAGPIELYFLGRSQLLLFRGGEFQSYWLEDAYDAYSLVRYYGSVPIDDKIILVQEHRGDLTIHKIDLPPDIDYTRRAEKVVDEAESDPPGRISKRTHRALRVCRHCPVKQRCDATDKLRGEDDDWSTSYPVP